MGKIINNFNQFKLNEATELGEIGASALINLFFEILNSREFQKDNKSYSYLASDSSRDVDTDYNEILEIFKNEGWTEQALKNLFDNYGDDLIRIYNDGEGCRSRSKYHASIMNKYPDLKKSTLEPNPGGMTDLLFYKMDGRNLLSGMEYKASNYTGDYWVKFSYGYQNSSYGKLVIEQQFETKDEWFKFGFEQFAETLTNDHQDFDLDVQADIFKYDLKKYDVFDTYYDTLKNKKLCKIKDHNIILNLADVKEANEEKFEVVIELIINHISSLGFFKPDGTCNSAAGYGDAKTYPGHIERDENVLIMVLDKTK